MASHYIPYFTQRINGATSRLQRAACGVPTEARSHATEPTCLECQAWLERDAATPEDLEGLGLKTDANGFIVPKEVR